MKDKVFAPTQRLTQGIAWDGVCTNDQYNSWRGCALSVAMPQALRLRSVQVTND